MPVTRGAHQSGPEILWGARIDCVRNKATRTAYDCLQCRHFVNYVPAADGSEVTIRCLWADDDLVGDLMTHEARLVTVSPNTHVVEADELARQREIHHLLVVEHDVLVGIACRCDFLPPLEPDATVGEHMRQRVWVTSSRARLRDVAGLMAREEIDCLPVVDSSIVQGIITSRDLDRAGIGHAIDEAEA